LNSKTEYNNGGGVMRVFYDKEGKKRSSFNFKTMTKTKYKY